MTQNRSSAVMAQRAEPHDSLDYFPTPPWAARALCEHIADWGAPAGETAWEPACGEGHMVRPLKEYFKSVHASDTHDYSATWPGQDRVCDFLFPGGEPPHIAVHGVDWIITNPPFRLAEAFALRAFSLARQGAALLVRTAFLEGGGRFERLFHPHPPEWILQFTERVPMFKHRLDPDGSTATAYCWIIWLAPFQRARLHAFPAFKWIAPCRKRLERPGDYPPAPAAAPAAPMPLFADR